MFDGGAQELGVFFVGLVVAGAACFAEEAAVVLGVAEVLGGEGLLADELEAEAVCEGTDGFEEVTGEGFAAVAGLMVVADGGVESGGVEGDGDFGACEGVGEGQECVEGVARGAAVALGEVQAGGDDGAQAGKVGAGCGAFDAAQAFKAGGGGDVLLLLAQKGDGVAEFVAGVQAVAAQLLEPFALAVDFGVDEVTGVAQAVGGVEAEAGLFDAAAGVFVGHAEHEAGAALSAGEDDDAGAALAQVAQQAGIEGDATAQEDTADGGERDGADALAVFTEDEGACIKLEVDVAAIDEEAAHGGAAGVG